MRPDTPVAFDVRVTTPEGTPSGTVVFRDGDAEIGRVDLDVLGNARLVTSTLPLGSHTISARYLGNGPHLGSTSLAATQEVSQAAPVRLSASDVPVGQPPLVRALNPDGSARFKVLAYAESFLGGVRVAVGDVTGDGSDDLVTVPGPGGGPQVNVYDGITGKPVLSFMVFEESFTGGLYVTLADVSGRGYSQLVLGAGELGGPRVTVYDVPEQSVVSNFFSYDSTLRGGLYLASGDLNGDGGVEVLTGAGKGGGPQVTVYNGPQMSVVGTFMAGDASSRSGVGVGDVRADGTRLIRTAGGGTTGEFDQTFETGNVGIFVG